MQASSSIYLLASSPFLPFSSTKITNSNTLFPTCQKRIQSSSSTWISMKTAAAAASYDAPEVDYSSMASSVFPAEACDTLGGVACDVEMFPETKLKQEEPKKAVAASQTIDREYLQYDSPKTVFIAEACDDLGGEFCEPPYQSGAK